MLLSAYGITYSQTIPGAEQLFTFTKTKHRRCLFWYFTFLCASYMLYMQETHYTAYSGHLIKCTVFFRNGHISRVKHYMHIKVHRSQHLKCKTITKKTHLPACNLRMQCSVVHFNVVAVHSDPVSFIFVLTVSSCKKLKHLI